MKLLYIVPKIKIAGGVARVSSLKANYFVEHFNYEVHILSQNEGEGQPFYDFNSKIVFHNIILKGNVFHFLNSYKNQVSQKVNQIKPDVILVADNGLKAFIFPFIIKTKIPIILESHGSKFIEVERIKSNFLSKTIRYLKYKFKDFSAQKFTTIVALSNENLKEWNVNIGTVIPNPSWINNEITSDLKQRTIITVARNSHEKGLDRLLLIWKEIYRKHPEWSLDVYTDDIQSLEKTANNLEIHSGIHYFNFAKNIEEKYLKSSIYVMTSRFEGFPMVLLEAMASGLPCIAYDCPSGPRSIIVNAENGFLIPDSNIQMFVEKLSFLIENEDTRVKLGAKAKETSEIYDIHLVMAKWNSFLENLTSNTRF